MSARTGLSVMAAVLVVVLGLAGAAPAGSLDLQDGVMGSPPPPFRDIQETIWFQGYVADSGTGEPVNATYTVVARLYDSDVGGSTVWGSEIHPAVQISDGWFSIELGSIVSPLPAFDDPPYYLQLWVNGEMLEPRLKLASVPSAFQSLGADNGLNLPSSGSYGASGNVFNIVNTGPNICGRFEINNAGSSAGALYGKHNGTGPAVIAWHNGSGSALKAIANSIGYAGEFDGAVTVSESLRVEGLLRAQDNAVVEDTLLVMEGFVFPQDAAPGYVLRCADPWGNAEWGPPNVIDSNKSSGTSSLTGGGVVHHTGATATLTVPGPGYIVLESRVWFTFGHTSGTADKLYMEHSTSSDTSSGNYTNYTFWETPASLGSESGLDRTVVVSNTFAVTSSGTYTYYLIGWMTEGSGSGDYFTYTQTTGIYYPYPIPLGAEHDQEIEYPMTGDAAPR